MTSSKVNELKSILVVTLSNLGDVIMTTPVMMTLAAKFPQAKLTVVVGPRARCLLEKSPIIHRIVVYDKRASLVLKWKFLQELRKESYDWVVDLRNTAIPFLVSCKKRSPLFRKFKKVNMRERHLEILTMMGLPLGYPPAFQFFDKADEESCFKKLFQKGIPEKEGWILVAPGAASERKRWAVEHFREVILRLLDRTNKKILLIGAENERSIAEAVKKHMRPSVQVLCGEMTMAETAALISKAALVIANDSAIMHLGYELGTPTVGVFGPTDHEKYGHHGKFFRIAHEDALICTCDSHKLPYAERSCFHDLGPDRVFELSTELLNADPTSKAF